MNSTILFAFSTFDYQDPLQIASNENGQPPLSLCAGQINHDRLLARESRAMRHFEEQLMRIGRNVSREAQAIFDALSKT